MADINNPLVRVLEKLTLRLRTDVTAVKRNGQMAWTSEPMTKMRLAQHLNGGPARGCAFIRPGEATTEVATYDLDSHKGKVPWDHMVGVAQVIINTAALFGMRAHAFSSSGGNGIHLIFVFGRPQDAYSVRHLMKMILDTCGLSDGTGGVEAKQVEVFPKQDSVEVGSYGNQCILPLAGKSQPLIPELGFDKVDKSHAAGMVWRESEDVPVFPKPNVADFVGGKVDVDELRSALDAIPNSGDKELDYERWRDLVFAIHYEFDGSDEGYELAKQFSTKAAKFQERDLRSTWKASKLTKNVRITGRTVFKTARDHGWEYVPESFEPVTDAAPSIIVSHSRSEAIARDNKGVPLPTISNVVAAMRSKRYTNVEIRFDRFTATIVYSPVGKQEWVPVKDDDLTRWRTELESAGKFKTVSKENMRDAVSLVADENQFDTAIEWINSLKWDGVQRVSKFVTGYWGVHHSKAEYAEALSNYMWTAMAGRVLSPGMKCDMIPILYGSQGVGKTRGIKALVPSVEFYGELDLSARDADLARRMRGLLVGELGELRGFHSRDSEHIKSWLSLTHDTWIPKYKESPYSNPRRMVLFGTTNDNQLLSDPSGNRRMLPIEVGEIDVDGIEAVRDQLWAEAAVMFKEHGLLHEKVSELADAEHPSFDVEDPWFDAICDWLNAVDPMTGVKPCELEHLRMLDVLEGALNIESKSAKRGETMRCGGVLRKFGYERKVIRVGDELVKVWARKSLVI
jgi:hypothetical protein